MLEAPTGGGTGPGRVLSLRARPCGGGRTSGPPAGGLVRPATRHAGLPRVPFASHVKYFPFRVVRPSVRFVLNPLLADRLAGVNSTGGPGPVSGGGQGWGTDYARVASPQSLPPKAKLSCAGSRPRRRGDHGAHASPWSQPLAALPLPITSGHGSHAASRRARTVTAATAGALGSVAAGCEGTC